MTISFFSNFLNDHQLPFCEEIINHIGIENFHFVASRQIDQDRIEMGFENMNDTKPFVIKAYQDQKSFVMARRLMLESDVVIIGSSKNMPVKERSLSGKLTFRYNERILKRGDIHLFNPRLFKYIYDNFTRYKDKNVYTLCASAYTARDLALFGYPKSKCYKWGYFPKIKIYNDINNLIREKNNYLRHPKEISILWTGRLIGLKHPEIAIALAKILKKEGISFNLNIIGSGELSYVLNEMIEKFGLRDCVHLLGSMSPDKVRDYMEKSQIFLFTSDKKEGWGAVLNEAMNSGCAVVANGLIGSVPFLIENGKSGLIYKTQKELYLHVKELIYNPEFRQGMGKAAYLSILTKWNAKDAVNRLFDTIEALRNSCRVPVYEDGPCSLV